MEEQETEELGYALDGDELRSTVGMEDDARLQYFLDKAKSEGQVWTLGAEDDLVVLAGEDETPFVVAFPHPDFAEEWIEGTDIDEVDLVAIGTSDWAAEILPGLQEAEIQVLVFPTSQSFGVQKEATELAALLV